MVTKIKGSVADDVNSKIDSVAESFAGLGAYDEQMFSVTGWHAGSEVGGGDFVYRAGVAKSKHNGGTIISPTVPKVSEQAGTTLAERRNNYLAGAGETDATGSGVFVRLYPYLEFEQFGAFGNGTDDDYRPLQTVISLREWIVARPGAQYLFTQRITNDGPIKLVGYDAEFISQVATGNAIEIGTSTTARYDTHIEGARWTRNSGTHNCFYLIESLIASFKNNVIAGFQNYGINAVKSDGIFIENNRVFGGSIKVASEMDIARIVHNDVSTSTNFPAISVFGGAAVTVENNFTNQCNHEGIVIGFDTVRGEYPTALRVQGNYTENCCQTDTGSTTRPFIHIGAPIDETGATYTGTEVCRSVSAESNYINGDVLNPNLANVIPILFERVLEVDYGKGRAVNFNNNNPHVKYPAQRVRMGALEDATDISASGTNASIQVWRDQTSRFKQHTVIIQLVSTTTDASGNGAYTFSGVNTGLTGVTVGNIFCFVTPESDSRHWVSGKSVTAGAGPDDGDQISLTINVAGAPASSTINLEVEIKIKI